MDGFLVAKGDVRLRFGDVPQFYEHFRGRNAKNHGRTTNNRRRIRCWGCCNKCRRWFALKLVIVGIPCSNRLFAFLEMAPGCPKQDQTVPVWTVVEVMRPAAILVLEPEEIEKERSFIDEIVENRLSVPRDAIEAAFGEMCQWTNPDWGDDGNINLVCVKCLESLPKSGAVCPRCVNSSQPQ